MSIKSKIAGLSACLHFDNKFQLTAARTLFRRSRFVSHRLKGVEFVADQRGGDGCGLHPCLVGGMYTPFLDAAGCGATGAPLNVADVGANAGGFALIFAVRNFPVRKIVSVEMNPLTFARMQLNLLTAYGPRAVPLNAAVCDSSGHVNVAFTAGGTGEGLSTSGPGDGPVFSVRMMTLDELLDKQFPAQKIDVMKLDVEGSEWDILDTGNCQRLSDVRFLIVEVHPRKGRSVEDFDRAVATYGLRRVPIHNTGAEDVFGYVNEVASTR